MAEAAKHLSGSPGRPRGAATPDAAKRLSSALQRVPVWLVYALGFVPAVAYFALGVMDELGADPMKVLERELGEWALIFLIMGLCVTPLRQLLGLSLLRYRRALGLLGFWYVGLHLVTYMVLDQGLDWAAIWADIVKRPYITVGMASFVLLVPLAATSNSLSIRRLGASAWNRLHKLVYVAAAGGALHYLLVVKSWPLEPLIYAAIIAALLAWRVWRAVAKPARTRTARA
jgi:sulfoxide reductase heme-binding subunit YedZ